MLTLLQVSLAFFATANTQFNSAVSRNSDDNNNGSKRLGTSFTYSTLTRRRKGYLETEIDSIATMKST